MIISTSVDEAKLLIEDAAGRRQLFRGCPALTLHELIRHGSRTARDFPPGWRTAAYVQRLRLRGIAISTTREPHARRAGSHGRYALAEPIRVIAYDGPTLG